MQQKIKSQLILYRSPRHQIGLQINVKYGFIPHQIRYLAENRKHKKSQETMMKRNGRKYIQTLSYIASILSKENSRLIHFAHKLTSLKKISHDPPFVVNAQRAYDLIQNLTSRVFRRNKHIVSVSTSPMNCEAPLTRYLEPLRLLNSTEQLKFSSFNLLAPGKLTQFHDFLSTAYKRKSWPHLKTFLPVFHMNVGEPLLRVFTQKLNNILAIFKDYKSTHLGLRLVLHPENPPSSDDWDVIETMFKSALLSHLQISIKGELRVKHFDEFLKTFGSMGMSNSQEKRPLLLDFTLDLERTRNSSNLAQIFGVLGDLTQLKSLSLSLSLMSLDACNFRVLSTSICSMKNLDNIHFSLNSITCSKSKEFDSEFTRFLGNLDMLISLKQFDLGCYGNGFNITHEHLETLFESLQNLSELTVLKLVFLQTPINDYSLQQLTQVFLKTTKIEVLSLNVEVSKVSYENFVKFIKSVGSLKNLTDLTLDFYVDIFDVDCAKALEELLESLKGLNYVLIELKLIEKEDVEDYIMEGVRTRVKKLKDRMETAIVDVYSII